MQTTELHKKQHKYHNFYNICWMCLKTTAMIVEFSNSISVVCTKMK